MGSDDLKKIPKLSTYAKFKDKFEAEIYVKLNPDKQLWTAIAPSQGLLDVATKRVDNTLWVSLSSLQLVQICFQIKVHDHVLKQCV